MSFSRITANPYNRGVIDVFSIVKYILWAVLLGLGIWFVAKIVKGFTTAVNTFGNTFSVGGDDGSKTKVTDTAGGSYDKPNTKNEIKALVDLIYEKLEGVNFYMYPDVVNRLAKLSVEECKIAAYHYYNTYRKSVGKDFFDFIAGEWGSNDWMSSKYAPALNALLKTGLYKNKGTGATGSW